MMISEQFYFGGMFVQLKQNFSNNYTHLFYDSNCVVDPYKLVDCDRIFCVRVCPARSTDSFQNCSRWGETEFPTMLGTQYALT